MPQETVKPNSLDILMKASIPETKEVIIDNSIDLLGQDGVYVLQEVMTRVIPLFGRYLDDSLRDDVQAVVRKFPRSRSVKR